MVRPTELATRLFRSPSLLNAMSLHERDAQFRCPNCNAGYKIVRAEAPPGPTTDREITFLCCGGPSLWLVVHLGPWVSNQRYYKRGLSEDRKRRKVATARFCRHRWPDFTWCNHCHGHSWRVPGNETACCLAWTRVHDVSMTPVHSDELIRLKWVKSGHEEANFAMMHNAANPVARRASMGLFKDRQLECRPWTANPGHQSGHLSMPALAPAPVHEVA